MYNIFLIGAGQLGSRHLQGLKKIDVPVKISVVDPNASSLQTARERYEEIEENRNINCLELISSISEAPEVVDLCVIATNSDIRASVTRELISKRKVKSILFEKFLFQKISDYRSVENLLNENGIKAWVNCARRLFPGYIDMKKYFSDNEKLIYCISGGQWGMACNSIHFIDHLSFFNGNHDFSFDASSMDKIIHKSKRAGYIEFSGTLKGKQSNGSEIIIHSRNESNAPFIISVLGNKAYILIDEANRNVKISLLEKNWKWENSKLDILYQSQLTGEVSKQILTTGSCNLPSFDESSKLHLSLLTALLKFYNETNKSDTDTCPIT